MCSIGFGVCEYEEYQRALESVWLDLNWAKTHDLVIWHMLYFANLHKQWWH
jgi:hypothetical protein